MQAKFYVCRTTVNRRGSGLGFHTAAERPHVGVLRVDLGDVGHPLAQHVDGDLVVVAVLELRSLVSRTPHLRLAVGWRERGREGETSLQLKSHSTSMQTTSKKITSIGYTLSMKYFRLSVRVV